MKVFPERHRCLLAIITIAALSLANLIVPATASAAHKKHAKSKKAHKAKINGGGNKKLSPKIVVRPMHYPHTNFIPFGSPAFYPASNPYAVSHARTLASSSDQDKFEQLIYPNCLHNVYPHEAQDTAPKQETKETESSKNVDGAKEKPGKNSSSEKQSNSKEQLESQKDTNPKADIAKHVEINTSAPSKDLAEPTVAPFPAVPVANPAEQNSATGGSWGLSPISILLLILMTTAWLTIIYKALTGGKRLGLRERKAEARSAQKALEEEGKEGDQDEGEEEEDKEEEEDDDDDK